MFDEAPRRDGRLRREISSKELQRWHRMFYQSGMSLVEIGRLVGVSPRYLSACFHRAGLPVSRTIEGRYWRP